MEGYDQICVWMAELYESNEKMKKVKNMSYF